MKKTLFRGFKPVFAFTAKQNLKTKGFLVTTILVAIIMFALPFGANVFMGFNAKKEAAAEEEPSDGTVDAEEKVGEYIHSIYFVNNTELPDEVIQAAMSSYCLDYQMSISVKMAHNEDEAAILKNAKENLKSSEVIYSITEEDDKYQINAYAPEDKEDVWKQAEEISDYLVQGMPNVSYAMAGLDTDTIVNIAAGSHGTVTKAGEKAEEIGVIMVRMLLPMLVGLLLYMLISMSVQSVTKVVIAEKTSKLMETLLTSAMPYGIVAGKILAVTVMAIAQMLFWLLTLVIGFVTGNMVAESICPGYENSVVMIIDMIRENTAGAFDTASIVMAIVMMMLGFLFYCVYAGLVGTFVQKVEDLSNTQVFIVFPLMIAWLAAYFAPALENEALLTFVRIFPLTSPFSIPADVIVGNVGVVMAASSLGLLAVLTAAMIIATGYMYKKRVFR